jgi:hypothetical protein
LHKGKFGTAAGREQNVQGGGQNSFPYYYHFTPHSKIKKEENVVPINLAKESNPSNLTSPPHKYFLPHDTIQYNT